MKKIFRLLFALALVSATAGCSDDDSNNEPDTSLGKIVEGNYPVAYTIDGGEAIDTYINVKKGSDISAIMTAFQGPATRETVVAPESILFKIGLSLDGELGAVEFSGSLSQTTVYIGATKYENARIRIEGRFDHCYTHDNPESEASEPIHRLEFTAVVTPEWEEGMEEAPAAITIEAKDRRLWND